MKTGSVLSLLMFVVIFFACDPNEDPCQYRHCNLRGFCDDGSCVCDKGWAGPNCDEEAIPDTIYLTRLTFSNIPVTDRNRPPLDPVDGPDLYLELENVFGQAGSTKWVHPQTYPDADSTGTFIFDFPDGLGVPNLLYFQLKDQDGGPTDENAFDDRVPACIDGISPRGLLINEGVHPEYTFDLSTTIAVDNNTGETWRVRNATVKVEVDWRF